MTIHKKFFLRNVLDVRRYISRLMNTVEAGQVDCDTARTLGYLSKIIIKSVEVIDLQSELKTILAKLEEIEGKQK